MFYYGLDFHDLAPNFILNISAFIVVCEAFVRIKPHVGLSLKIFNVKPKIMVMHSNERGDCCPRTLVDRKWKRQHNAVDVVKRLHDPTDEVPNVRHLRVQHTFSSMTSLEHRSSRVLTESFVSTTAW